MKTWGTASQIERLSECPASAVLPHVEFSSPKALIGKAHHAEIEALIDSRATKSAEHGYTHENLAIPIEAHSEVAFSYDVVGGEAKKLGKIKERSYPDAPFSTIFGTSDALYESEVVVDGIKHACVDIVDWKKTYEAPPPDSMQMRILAFMAARSHGLDYARTRITHLRDDAPYHSEFKLWTQADFSETEKLLKRTYDAINKIGWKDAVQVQHVRPGPHCHFCPAYVGCPYTMSVLRLVSECNVEGADGQSNDEGSVASIYAAWQSARTLVGRLEERVKTYAEDRPIDIGNGYMYGKPSEGGNFRRFRKWKEE